MSFYTDVIMPSPSFNSVNRVADVNLLEPVTRSAVAKIIQQAQATYGISLIVFETYRSQARQTQLFNQRATELKIVGVHHFGLACDLVKNIGGQPSWKGDFSFLGALAKANNLVWGGNWGHPQPPPGFKDLDHVQRCSVAMQPQLFAGTWYPDATYSPYNG